MSFSTIAEVIAFKGPSFLGDSRLGGLESAADMYVSMNAYGARWIYAKALLVLHWLTLDAQGGGSSSASGSGIYGGVSEEKEGGLSRKYNLPSNISEKKIYLMSTSFGAEFLMLSDTCILSPMTRRNF